MDSSCGSRLLSGDGSVSQMGTGGDVESVLVLTDDIPFGCPIHKIQSTHYCMTCCEPICRDCLRGCSEHYVIEGSEVAEVFPWLTLAHPSVGPALARASSLLQDMFPEHQRVEGKHWQLLQEAVDIAELEKDNNSNNNNIDISLSRLCAATLVFHHFFHTNQTPCTSVNLYEAFPSVDQLPYVVEAKALDRDVVVTGSPAVRMSKTIRTNIPCYCSGMVNGAISATGHFINLDDRSGHLRVVDLIQDTSVNLSMGKHVCAVAPFYTSLALIPRGKGEIYRVRLAALMAKPKRSSFRLFEIPPTMNNSYFCDTTGCSRTGLVSYLTATAHVLRLDLVSLKTTKEYETPQCIYFANTTDISLGKHVHVGSKDSGQAIYIGEDGKAQNMFGLSSYGVVFIPNSRKETEIMSGVAIDLLGHVTTTQSEMKLKEPFYFKANNSIYRLNEDVFLAYDDKLRCFVVLRISIT